MTTPADNEDSVENDGPPPFSVFTPFGIFHDAADLPPEVRDFLISQVSCEALPLELRVHLAEQLGVDINDLPSLEDPAFAIETHREDLWRLLDSAFPDAPHLWSAGEALFSLSAMNPAAVDAEARATALEVASRHLQRHAALTQPQLSPADQLIAEFRQQMHRD